MRLYRSAGSPNCLKVELLLAHLGLEEVEFVEVELAKGEQFTPEFLAVNPAGKVPVLVDGDFTLPESGAILVHLAERAGAGELVGQAREERMEVLRWLFFEASQLGPAAGLVKVHTDVLPPDQRVPAVAETGRHLLARFVPVLDARLRTRDYVAGRLSVADFATAPVQHLLQQAGVLDNQPGIAAWLDRMRDLPAWQQAAARPPWTDEIG